MTCSTFTPKLNFLIGDRKKNTGKKKTWKKNHKIAKEKKPQEKKTQPFLYTYKKGYEFFVFEQ